jgi:hypothetical protein
MGEDESLVSNLSQYPRFVAYGFAESRRKRFKRCVACVEPSPEARGGGGGGGGGEERETAPQRVREAESRGQSNTQIHPTSCILHLVVKGWCLGYVP